MGEHMEQVTKAVLKGGGSLFASFKYHWWELELACGHTVERRIRWKPRSDGKRPARGWSALHHPPGLDRLPDPPKRAKCEFCERNNR